MIFNFSFLFDQTKSNGFSDKHIALWFREESKTGVLGWFRHLGGLLRSFLLHSILCPPPLDPLSGTPLEKEKFLGSIREKIWDIANKTIQQQYINYNNNKTWLLKMEGILVILQLYLDTTGHFQVWHAIKITGKKS